MKRLSVGWLAICLWGTLSAQTTLHGLNLDVLQFSASGAPYIEVQVEISASISPESTEDVAIGELTLVASRGDEVLNFAKTNLTSTPDSTSTLTTFVHIERLPVTPGPVNLEMTLRSSVDGSVLASQDIQTEARGPESPWISDIMLLEAWAPTGAAPSPLTRSGFEMLPLVGAEISESADEVRFYAEIYHTDELADSLFLLTAEWLDGNGHVVPGTTRYFRKSAASTLPIFERMPLGAATSARPPLVLRLQAANREGLPIAEQFLPVRRIDPEAASLASDRNVLLPFAAAFTDSLALMRHLEDHHPFANHAEQQYIDELLTQSTVPMMQSFLDGFWRAHAPEDPEQGWRNYTTAVAYVDSTYGACRSGRGARTDMGYTYLRYGPPNTIVKRHNETDYYPYEIWHYYTTRGQTNKRVLFMCPSAVAECFDMLHSDIRGETFNADWLTVLRTRENGLRVTDSQINRLNPRQNTFTREEPEDLFFNPR